MPYHRTLHLQDFTAFSDAQFEFAPGINVIIGANGTGKTHLLKVLYAVQFSSSRPQGNRILFNSLIRIFQIEDPISLIRQGSTYSMNVGGWGDDGWSVEIETVRSDDQPTGLVSVALAWDMPRPVFIPATDMMGHTRRFISTYDEYQIDFDQTHRDAVALLLAPERRHTDETTIGPAKTLLGLLGGEVEEEAERFYLKTSQGRQPMPLVAEGLRKLATLYQLMKKGFLRPGSVLFWDEPEVNLSPTLMDELIGVLLALARSGVQIFLTTHSYVILKELDLQAVPEDKVRFFGLEPSEDGTKVHTADNYAELAVNPIMEQFDFIYDRELTRATGRTRKRNA